MKTYKRNIFFFLMTFCVLSAFPSIVQNETGVIRLDNDWQFYKGNVGSLWEVFRPVIPGKPESVPIWTSVSLPHCFNADDAVDPDVNYYQGPGWYRRLLTIDKEQLKGRILLYFEGSGQKTDVYIYTKPVGSHTGGYDEWYVDITDAVASFLSESVNRDRWKGQIPLAVKCDNTRNMQMIPSNLSDFTLYGGLYRHVKVLSVPSVYCTEMKIDPRINSNGKEAKVNISLLWNDVRNLNSGHLTISIFNPQGVEIASSSDRNASFNIRYPQLWSTDTPQLYTCKVRWKYMCKEQTFSQCFGFRSFSFEKKGPFLLNGKRLLLRGTHRHEDFAGVGAAMSDDMIRQEMNQMKMMGVNFIRLGHYQQPDLVLRLCDELGILVWEEIPWCRGGIGGSAYKNQARNMLLNLIKQHYNHPSVILWGLGNENDWPGDFEIFSKDSIRSFMTELNNLAHTLDKSRLTVIRRCDFCKDIPDVYSPSIWAGWYFGNYRIYSEMMEKRRQDSDRFFHAEWGGDSHAGRHSENTFDSLTTADRNGDWSESYIIRLFDWHLKEQEKMPWLTGSAFWTFRDFATPLRPDNPIPYINQKGVVQRDGTPKESYYVFQSYWTDRLMAHIYGHTWPVRWGQENEKKEVLVYSNCTKAELFINGISQGVRFRNSQDYPAAGLHWSVVYKKGMNKLKVVAWKGQEIIKDEIEQKYQTDKWAVPTQIRMSVISHSCDTVLVKAELLDKGGILCLDASSFIRFGFAGDGRLMDNQGTATGSRKIQTANGRAFIRVRLKGKGAVSAYVEGLPAQTLELQ